MKRHRLIAGMFLIGFFSSCLLFSLMEYAAHARSSVLHSGARVPPTIQATATSVIHTTNNAISGFDSTTWAAIITAIASIIAGLISALFGIDMMRRTGLSGTTGPARSTR